MCSMAILDRLTQPSLFPFPLPLYSSSILHYTYLYCYTCLHYASHYLPVLKHPSSTSLLATGSRQKLSCIVQFMTAVPSSIAGISSTTTTKVAWQALLLYLLFFLPLIVSQN